MRPTDWQLEPGNILVLRAAEGHELCDIALEQCTTSAQVLDQVAQIVGKPWATVRVVADLVRKLDEALDLQANYCSGGKEQGPVNTRKVLLRERTRKIQPLSINFISVGDRMLCPGCAKEIEDPRIIDSQIRYWHPQCAETALGEHASSSATTES